MSEERRLEKKVVLHASPEQVWEAIATGPGIATWFVPHEIDPPEGGPDARGGADFGSGNVSDGRVLAWEPGRRVVFGGSGDQPDEALEFLIEGREGGSTVLRFVHSGFGGEDWEGEYHSKGWDVFFHNLVQYFEHFAGLPVVNALAMNFTALGRDAVWSTFHRELGVDPAAGVGDPVRLAPAGFDPVVGVVDVRDRGMLGVRTDNALYRFGGEGADAWGMVNVFHYLYGVDVDRETVTAAWQAWLDRLFPESA